MEGNGRNKLKQGKIEQNGQFVKKSKKIRAIQSTSFLESVDRIFRRLSVAALAIGKLYPVSFFSTAEMGKLGRFISRLRWLYKDIENSPSGGGDQKPRIKERVKKKRRASGQF